MTLRHRPGTARPAFTLVELLVAMALILFIMVILSEAFVAGLESFRQLKAIGDMEERLRTAAVEIRRDLNADHFEGRRRLSDPNFWFQPVREGFFQITQGTGVPTLAGPYYLEGVDDVGNNSYRATDHRLHFTVKLRGNQQDRFFQAIAPPNGARPSPLLAAGTNFFNQSPDGRFQPTTGSVYSSPWAEVAYFLVPTGTNAGSGVPLYSLYRSQLIVVPDNRNVNWHGLPGQAATDYRIDVGQLDTYLRAGFSCEAGTAGTGTPSNIYFNCPSDLANGMRAIPTADLRRVANPNDLTYLQMVTQNGKSATLDRSLLLTDVISFQVRVLTSGQADFTDLGLSSSATGGNFDTSDPSTARLNGQQSMANILAIQVTLRVWDIKTEQARQITIVQDM